MSAPPIISTAWDGKSRVTYLYTCEKCGGDVWRPKKAIRTHVFCSQTCSQRASRKKSSKPCAHCGALVTRSKSRMSSTKSGLVFCNRLCKEKAQALGGLAAIQPQHYGKGTGVHTYRSRALRHYGSKCMGCGYSQHEALLDVHHKDGNKRHNNINNLTVLCVWCHTCETRGIIPHPWVGTLGP